MAVKCTECGASIQDDSRFCRYCGAKIIQDNLKRVEVKIDNTAEIKRANYEERESLLRQEKMKRELRKEKRRPYIILAKILSVVIPFVVASMSQGTTLGVSIFIGGLFFAFWLLQFLNK